MTVVRIPPTLRAEAGGARQVVAEGENVRDLLEDLTGRFPALGERILEADEVAPFVNVYVDGEDIRTRDGLETPVREGDQVILLPAMAGGSSRPWSRCLRVESTVVLRPPLVAPAGRSPAPPPPPQEREE